MILNNCRKYTRRVLAVKNGTSNSEAPIYNYKDVDGYTGNNSDGSAMYIGSVAFLSTNITNLTYENIDSRRNNNELLTYAVIGSGTTEATENDYNLENGIYNDLVISTTNSKNTEDLKIITTISNTGDSDITINEIGLVMRYYQSSYRWNNTSIMKILLTRTVLPNSIILAAGNTMAIEIDLFKDIITIVWGDKKWNNWNIIFLNQ